MNYRLVKGNSLPEPKALNVGFVLLDEVPHEKAKFTDSYVLDAVKCV
jgi:hypothetical protein